jgi:hypothetical protein
MSHEALGPRDVYQKVYGLPFETANPGADGGIELLNHYMQVDYALPHSFRPQHSGHTRVFIIVDEDKIDYPTALMPDLLLDSDLARYQFRHWRHTEPRLTVKGLLEHGPEKMNDDFGNGLMMLFHDNIVRAAPLTKEERIEAMLLGTQELFYGIRTRALIWGA